MTQVAPYPTTPSNTLTFGAITDRSEERTGIEPNFAAIHAGREFNELRSRFRRFVFPVSTAALLWFIGYVLLVTYAGDWVGQRLFGPVNVALALGLAQIGSTVGITAWYLRFARRRLDPQVAAVRAGAGATRAGAGGQ